MNIAEHRKVIEFTGGIAIAPVMGSIILQLNHSDSALTFLTVTTLILTIMFGIAEYAQTYSPNHTQKSCKAFAFTISMLISLLANSLVFAGSINTPFKIDGVDITDCMLLGSFYAVSLIFYKSHFKNILILGNPETVPSTQTRVVQ